MVPGSLPRPADMLFPSWSCGRPAALDIHVISPLQQLTLAETSVSPGHALQIGVQRKLASNLPACQDAGVQCRCFVTETLGGLAQDAIRTICHLPLGSDRFGSLDPSASAKHLFQRFAISLSRGNACFIVTRLSLPLWMESPKSVFLVIFFCFFLDVCNAFFP